MSAFQALGPFISTFANPNMTGLYFDQDGILRVQESESVAATVTSIKPQAAENKRSEEHTSELQSPCNLVCRLLLEKKKKKEVNIC